jgi:hypothetical protein
MKKEIFETILSSTDNLGEEYLEMGLDSFLDDGIIKEVPIVNKVYSILKIGINISQAFFLKNLTNFIVYISDFSLEDRKEFVKKYKRDDKDFSEKLILVLDRLDETDKCYYLSQIFKSYAYGKIDYTLFRFFVNH